MLSVSARAHNAIKGGMCPAIDGCDWPDRCFEPRRFRDYCKLTVPSSVASGGAIVTDAGGGFDYAHFFADHANEALGWTEKASRQRPDWLTTLRIGVACYAAAGRVNEARKLAAGMGELHLALGIANLRGLHLLRLQKDFEWWSEALRKAGAPRMTMLKPCRTRSSNLHSGPSFAGPILFTSWIPRLARLAILPTWAGAPRHDGGGMWNSRGVHRFHEGRTA